MTKRQTDEDGPEFTAWITKYAMTTGVFKCKARVTETSDAMIEAVGLDDEQRIGLFHGEGRDWHRTEESARKRFDAMRTAKLKALDKQHAKIANMEFEVKS